MSGRTRLTLGVVVGGYIALFLATGALLAHEWVTRQMAWFAVLSLLLLAGSRPSAAMTSWLGLAVGVVAGELIGGALYDRALEEFNRDPQAHSHLPFHYGWIIAAGCFAVGAVVGLILERRPDAETGR